MKAHCKQHYTLSIFRYFTMNISPKIGAFLTIARINTHKISTDLKQKAQSAE